MWGIDTGDDIGELFRSFLHNYQEELKIIGGSKFNPNLDGLFRGSF